jgi:putative ABC transport system ATP-binding protein
MLPVVEGIDISKIYYSGKVEFQALRNINIRINPGDFAVLSGPSGSGKTTLLNLFGGLDAPSQGTINIQGINTNKYKEKQMTKLRSEKIGFIFQNFNLIPTLTAYENIELPLILKKVGPGERKSKVRKLLAEVGLADKEKNFPAALSGGQQQRVAIARALIGDPVLVLADEPTANLDSQTGQSIISLLKKLNEERAVTVLFSTHDPHIMQCAKRIIHLKDGAIDGEENLP